MVRHSIAKRMRAKLVEIKEALNRMRHVPVPDQGRWLGQVMPGYAAYFAVPTRLRTHNQKMTVAAMQMALMKVWAQRSYRVAMRRQSLSLPNMRSMRLRCL